MDIAKRFGLTHALLSTVREVVAAEGKVKEYGVDHERKLASQKKKMIPAPKKIMVAKGTTGGVRMISKKSYNPKKHTLASGDDVAHDPVGREDSDVDNDNKVTNSDKYLMKRRRAIAMAMKKESSTVKMSGKKEKINMKPKM